MSCRCTGGVMLRAGALACATCGTAIALDVASAPRPFSQLDGERPPGCGRVRFRRVWKKARDAGDPGATVDGRARLLTRDAYERHRPRASAPTAKAKPQREEPDAFGALLADLGLAPAKAS